MSAPQEPISPITTMTSTTSSNLLSSFGSSATAYERRIGRATRAIATHIVTSILPTLPTRALILDNACGTGAIASAALQRYPSAQIRCVDASPDMIDIMHAQIRSNGWNSNVSAAVMSGQDLKFGDSAFDASVTNFGIFFFPDPAAGAIEIRRTLKEGGMAVLTCWRTFAFEPLFDAAEAIIKPATPFQRPTFLYPWKDPTTLRSTLEAGGFAPSSVSIERSDVWFWGTDLKDLCGALTENMLGFVGEDWTAEEKGRLEEAMMEVVLGFEGMKVVKSLDAEGEEWKGRVGLELSVWIGVARK